MHVEARTSNDNRAKDARATGEVPYLTIFNLIAANLAA